MFEIAVIAVVFIGGYVVGREYEYYAGIKRIKAAVKLADDIGAVEIVNELSPLIKDIDEDIREF